MNRLLRLISEVRFESQSSDMVDTRKYTDRFEKIKRDARVVIYLDPNADMSFLHKQLQAYSQVFNKFIETSDKEKFKEQYEIVERILFTEDYQTGIRKLRNLMVDFPHEVKLSELLSRSETRYKISNRNVVGSFEAQGLFAEALNEMHIYCAVISCNPEEYSRIDQLETAYFNSELAGFESAIKKDQKSAATKHITTLKSLAFANPGRYRQAHDAYNAYLVNSEMREVELDLYRKNYHAAFAKVKRIENTYGSNYSSLQTLKRTTVQKLFRSEVILEKQKRQKLFSVALGAGVFTNNIESIEYIDQQIQTLTWFYSAGLYKKLNYKFDMGAYPKKSDVIGIRFRVIDYKTTSRLQYGENPEIVNPYRYDTELALDGTVFRGIHYAFGVIFLDRQFEDNLLYTVELGVNIPLHPVSIQINARSVFYNPKPIYTLSGGISLSLDFWRKFNARDKRNIRKELGLS